ncbi:MAG: protein-export chaperone SecB [Sedimenticola sp.]
MSEENQTAENQPADNQPQFNLQHLYLKDVSFETPNSPHIFTQMGSAQPETSVNFNTEVNALDEAHHEVVLTATITTKVGDKTAYLVEVQQAGIFFMSGFNEHDLGPLTRAHCPNIIYPYVRQTVSELIGKGGFPPLLLQPYNFEALYAQQMQQQAAASDEQPAAN